MKKRQTAKILVIILCVINILSPIGGRYVKAEEGAVSANYRISTPVQVEEFYFTNISLVYDGFSSTLRMDVTNMGDKTFEGYGFYISMISSGREMIKMLGYIGDNLEPGETRTIVNGTDMNLMSAELMVISVKGREENRFQTNTCSELVKNRTIDEGIYISNIQVYGYEQWFFECDVENIGKWYWNYKLHFQFKDEEGNIVSEFMEDLPKSFETGKAYEIVYETSEDLSKASYLEIDLLRKMSPRVERNDMLILHSKEEEKEIIVEEVSAVREANCEWWDVSIAFYNCGAEKKRVSIDKIDFINESVEWVGVYDEAKHLDLEGGERTTYKVKVFADIENMHCVQVITDVAMLQSPKPTVTPVVTESPKPTTTPVVTSAPKPTVTPVVTESPKPTPTPVVTERPKISATPVVPESPKPIEIPIVTERPKETATPETAMPLMAVKGVKAKVMGNSVKVSWNLTKGASTYRIYRSTKKNTEYKLIKEVMGKAKYIDRKVKKGKSYYYKICVVGSEKFLKPVLARVPYYMQPRIKVKNKSFSSSLNYVEITLKKYEGKFLQLYYKKGKGKFKRVSLRSNRLKKEKNMFRISYQKAIKTLYFKVRTYGKLKGKKRYSDFSKIVRIKNGK